MSGLKQRKPVEHKSIAAMEKYYEKLQARPPCSELQKLAQKENYALFVLTGMKGQLVHLMNVPGIGTSNVEKIRLYCNAMESNIKRQQQLRKNRKAQKS